MSIKPLALLRLCAGLILLMLGIIGLILPILQGWLLILVAVPLISPEHGKKLIVKLKEVKRDLRAWLFEKKKAPPL